MVFELIFLFLAGFCGGTLNSIAGGGTFITFPALLYVGIPPIIANATNTFASCSGYISGTFAFREDLKSHKSGLTKFIILSFLGGILGAGLLLQTPEQIFSETIPWLMLIATFVFIYGTKINERLGQLANKNKHISTVGKIATPLLLLLVCFYGGFFNAGLGIICLSYLALCGYTNINAMNGLKLLISSCVSIVAIGLFAFNDAIAWNQGTAVLLGTVTGGYLAARVSRYLPQIYIRNFVILIGICVTLYFFYDLYWAKA
jgi:uncharacterized membrane protein YfcA